MLGLRLAHQFHTGNNDKIQSPLSNYHTIEPALILNPAHEDSVILSNTVWSMVDTGMMPWLSPSILTAQSHGILHRMLGKVPMSLTRGLILEARLAEDSNQIDFSLHLTRNRGGDVILAGVSNVNEGRHESEPVIQDQLAELVNKSQIWRR